MLTATRRPTASLLSLHALVLCRMSTATDAVSIALPKFLVTTVEMKSQDGDKVVFDRYSKQGGELPMFLVDVKYEDKASVAAQLTPQDNTETKIKTFADEGKGDFSGTAVSQAGFRYSSKAL